MDEITASLGGCFCYSGPNFDRKRAEFLDVERERYQTSLRK
jgi:hypothetical protein